LASSLLHTGQWPCTVGLCIYIHSTFSARPTNT
jgi:hypothetical protein